MSKLAFLFGSLVFVTVLEVVISATLNENKRLAKENKQLKQVINGNL